MRSVGLARLLLAASGLVWTGCSSGSHGAPSDGSPTGTAGQGDQGGGAGGGSTGTAGQGGQIGGTGGGAVGSGGQASGAGGHGGGGGGTIGSGGQGGQAGGAVAGTSGNAGQGGQPGGAGGASSGNAGRGGQGGAAGTSKAGSGGSATAGSGGATGGLCAEGWCWLSPQLQGNGIDAVFARTPSDVWLVGIDGIILHWNGASFTPYDVTNDDLYGVWAASSTFAVAAAYDYPNQTEYLLRWDGNTWTRWMDSPVPNGDAIWGTSANDFWIAGWPGAAHWDGTKFTVDNTPIGDVISGAAADDIFIGQPQATAMFHYDGKSWTQMPAPPDGVKSIAAMGGGKAWMCAGTDLTVPMPAYWDGAAWTTPDSTMTSCQHIFTPDRSTVWASSYTDVFELSGGKWASLYHGPDNIISLGGSSSSDIWAAGIGGEILRGGTQGMTELAHARPLTNRSVWPVGPNDAWVASPGAMGVLRWKDGQPADSWAAANPRAVNDVMGRSASDLWVVGAAGLAAHYDGTSWTEVDVAGPNAPDLYGVWENAPTEVWAVGKNETTWLYDGSHWRSYSAGYVCGPSSFEPTFGHHLWSDGQNVLMASGNCVAALPDKPTAPGGYWNVVFQMPAGDLKGVWMTSDGYVFAAGYDVTLPQNQGILARYKGPLDGTASGTLNVVSTERVMQDVWASSGTDAWAVGYATIVHWDGSNAPTRSKLATTDLWRVVGLPGTSELWTVGESFAVLRHP
jgi:hypothetical protein